MIGLTGAFNGALSTNGDNMPGGVNNVYKSTKMELSYYISKNKSNIDYRNT